MSRAHSEIELAVRLGSAPGVLGRVLSLLADHSINILAYCAYNERQDLVLRLVSNDPFRAKEVRAAAGDLCRASAVVLVGAADQVGSAATIGSRLGIAGVNILYSYASSAGANQFYAVFRTNDNRRALLVLNASDQSAARAA